MGPLRLPLATCRRLINALIEWWVKANIMGFHYSSHINKLCEVDCSGVVLDGITPGVSLSLTHGSEPLGMPSALQG